MNEEIDDLYLEEEEERDKSFSLRLLKIAVALLLIAGLVFISGIREYLFFTKTSPDTDYPPMEEVIEGERIVVPLKMILLREKSEGTSREKSELEGLVKNTSNIWNQAKINFSIERERVVDLDKREIDLVKSGNFNALSLDEEKINVILVGSLRDLNGVAFPSKGAVIIPDYTTGYDFRVLAHEIGHILSLPHREGSSYLMSTKALGYALSLEEIKKAREKAYEKF